MLRIYTGKQTTISRRRGEQKWQAESGFGAASRLRNMSDRQTQEKEWQADSRI
jgi:hypothetical protein